MKDLQRPITLMPRDVATRWNSTFDLLRYGMDHKEAIDVITRRRDLRKFELVDEEWELVEQLCSVLKVRAIAATNKI